MIFGILHTSQCICGDGPFDGGFQLRCVVEQSDEAQGLRQEVVGADYALRSRLRV